MSKQKTAPKILVQRNYISVDFGNGRRLTAGFSREKSTGAVPEHVFDAWLKAIDGAHVAIKESYEKPYDPDGPNHTLLAIEKFVKDIDTIWPEWNKATPEFAIGARVLCNFGKRKGVDVGTVVGRSRHNYDVDFDKQGKIRVAGDLLKAKVVR